MTLDEETKMGIRYAVYELYHYWLQGEPCPLDVFEALIKYGYKPERLVERFTEGEIPPFSDEEERIFSLRMRGV